MEITFWGVRGSIPAPGPEFNRYGGNTSCVAIRSAAGDLYILDAGMGATVLGQALMKTEFGKGKGAASLLLTHTHWDHIQGFPFFVPFFIPGNTFRIYGTGKSPEVLEGILDGQFNPHFSPLHSLGNLPAKMDFHVVREGGKSRIQSLTLTACSVAHGRCEALAYRLEEQGKVVVFAPDVAYPDGRLEPGLEHIYSQADYLIHDTTYTPEDQQGRQSRGHSTIADAARVAARCEVKNLVMFHYDQDYTDDQVDTLEERCRACLDAEPGGKKIGLIASREGLTITL